MEIVINTNDSLPLFAQLIEQIKKAVLSGKLSSGSAMPSIRQLANDLELNHNTVAKAYRLLERDAVIETTRSYYVHKTQTIKKYGNHWYYKNVIFYLHI